MKLALKFIVLGASMFIASSAMAACPTNMQTDELIDCLIQEEHEPDITELMTKEASKNKATQISESTSIKLVKSDSTRFIN